MIKDNQFFNNVKDNNKNDTKNEEDKVTKDNVKGDTKETEKNYEKDLEEDEELEDDVEDDNDENGKNSVLKEKSYSLMRICKNNKKGMIIALILIAVISIGVVTVVTLGRNGKFSNTGTEIATTTNEHIDVIPAEVGDIDDPNDPQLQNANNSEGTGAQMSASDMKKTSNMSNGIDISKFQGKVDWDAVAATKKIDFAMIRVGYRTDNNGTIVEDLYAKYNMQKAAEAGIKIGVYFFSTATTKEEALEEAAWTTDIISKYKITYPVVYNCEGYTDSTSRMYGVSNADRTDYAIAFLNYVKNEGYEAMLYAGKTELDNSTYWDTNRVSANYKIWVAQYPDQLTEKSSYTGTNAMWQYTCNGKLAGVNGLVDMDIAYFYYENAVEPKDTSGAANADNPELGVTFTAASGEWTAKDETNLRSLPNTSGDIIANIKNGEFATLIANGDNGWSKLLFNGTNCYALTRLLTDKLNEVAVVPVTPATPTGPKPDIVDGVTFTTASGQLTAKDETNIRSGPSTSGSVVATIKNGQFATLLADGNNGWSRLEYDGKIGYAKKILLTTDETQAATAKDVSVQPTTSGVTMAFATVNEQVTPKNSTNLRSLPDQVTGAIVIELKNGVYVTRTGTSDAGWSRLVYNGQTVYALTSYLTK